MSLLLYWLFMAHLQALHLALMGETSDPCCIYPLPHSYKIIELNRRNLGGNLVLQLTQENEAERTQNLSGSASIRPDSHSCHDACGVLGFLKEAVLQQQHPAHPCPLWMCSSCPTLCLLYIDLLLIYQFSA